VRRINCIGPNLAPLLAAGLLAFAPAPASAQKPCQQPNSKQATASLDFAFYKSNVEPIFLKARPGHARCYACHSEGNRTFHLEKLPPDAIAWNDEQSRKNFQSAIHLVVRGNPDLSPLLLHPLAPEAGGDAFHSGGRQFVSQNDSDWLALAEWVRGAREDSPAACVPQSAARIYVTDSAADTVDVIDSATNKIVQVIRGIELPHGVNFSPDGNRVYVSSESESVLDVIDAQSGQILRKIPLSGRPNNISVTKDGRRVVVGIRTLPGALDLIDTNTLTLAKTIPVNASVHNVYVTPDGKYAVSGSIESQSITVVDLQSDEIAWQLRLDRGVRPMAFERNPDGTARRIFVQLSGFNGFAVVDFAKRAEVARVQLPNQPGGFGILEGRAGTPSHGIGVAPDGKSLWIGSTYANAVFKYSLPTLTLMGYCPLPLVHPPGNAAAGGVPEWITFTPDSKFVYVSNSGARSVSAIDVQTLKEVAEIAVGEVPKRINTLALP